MAYSELGTPHDATATADICLEVCNDEFAAHAARMFDCRPIASASQIDVNRVLAWESDQSYIVSYDCTPHLRTRTEAHLSDVGHVLSICRFLSGGERGVGGNGLIHRVPGPIYVADLGRPFDGLITQQGGGRIRYQELAISKNGFDLSPEFFSRERAIENHTSAGMLLHTCMDEIFQAVDGGDKANVSALMDRFSALLKVNLGVHPQRGDVRAQLREALFDQILVFIEQNLGDLDLNTELILQSFGVSRASLYRMFESVGGVRSYIMQRRATRAALDVEKNLETRGYLRQASITWGYSSQANFNRAMRRHFGNSPSALFSRAERSRLLSGLSKTARLRQWFQRTAIAA